MTNKLKRLNSSSNFNIKIVEHKIDEREASRFLTEIAQLFYDVACQFHNSQNNKPIISKLDSTDSIQDEESA